MTTSNHSDDLQTRNKGMMRARQRPLMRRYKEEPEAAWITDGACTVEGAWSRNDPVHGELRIGTAHPVTVPLSIHSAVGGDHDGPNPGDYLAAALAGCFDTTLRIIANRFGVELASLSVSAAAELDVRGTLCVDADVPVGFQRMKLTVDIAAAPGVDAESVKMLVAATEHCCVVLRTLQQALALEVVVNHQGAVAESA
ncbi:MAG: OsmC family protein [Myxococcota bacterium]